VVIHSYRHRYGLAAGDPAYASIETALAAQPPIAVPTITIDGDADGVNPGTAHHVKRFVGLHEHRIFKGAGHNLPQERPEEWARAVIDARTMAMGEGTKGIVARSPGLGRDKKEFAITDYPGAGEVKRPVGLGSFSASSSTPSSAWVHPIRSRSSSC
jgi:hypothetical protein